MAASLRLNVPWVPGQPSRVGDLVISRGDEDVLAYDDGISLRVEVVDPASYEAVADLVAAARAAVAPGQLVLVAGAVPIDWRAVLRQSGLSFIDVGGVAQISWPRLRATSGQFGKEPARRRPALPLRKSHALVAEELLIAASDGQQPTISDLASHAGVSMSTASRTVAQLAELGLVEREQNWRQVTARVTDIAEVSELLASQTAWPGSDVVNGYVWGRNPWDIAATLSRNAADAGVQIAITGRAGAAFLGVLGTSVPREVRCWATLNGRSLGEVAAELGLEPAPRESVNVRVSADPWRIGIHRSSGVRFEEWTATVAHPLRVWCDLHAEERGREFASQLWGRTSHAR